MNQDKGQITDWLTAHKGSTILIEKLESESVEPIDQDLTRMELEGVSYIDNFPNQTDEYIAKDKFVLLGKGTILNNPEQPELPDQAYEIPLLGEWEAAVQGNKLHITTHRATYHISREQ